jgi:molybdopterin-guanine dinucleotide biosynthesis protein A
MKAEAMVTIVLLAGGKATRLPGKLTRAIGDEPMIVRVYRQLTRTGRTCIVSVREPLPAAIAQLIPAPIVEDAYGDAGPLGGLASAAIHVRTPLLFAAAADLPNVDAGVVDALEERYQLETRHSEAAPDVILPRHANGDVEPLAALYNTATLRTSAARTLAQGRKKVTQALEGLRVTYYDVTAREEMKFVNVNTADDLAGIQPA